MREDMLAKRISEVDYINGFICSKAKLLAIATEHNQYLFEQIKKQEACYD
jgi:ketopantoate reductase